MARKLMEVKPFDWRMRLALLTAMTIYALAGLAAAQATWIVDSLIPETLSIRVPTTTVRFSMSHADYPPAEFPATYAATVPENGVLPVQVFSNADGLWNLLIEIPDLLTVGSVDYIPASQVLYRVNGGVWIRADGGPQVVFTHMGRTSGWLELRIEFALELRGNEPAGAFLANINISAIREPGF